MKTFLPHGLLHLRLHQLGIPSGWKLHRYYSSWVKPQPIWIPWVFFWGEHLMKIFQLQVMEICFRWIWPWRLTASLPLKNAAWKTILAFLGWCMFRGELLNFGGVFLFNLGRKSGVNHVRCFSRVSIWPKNVANLQETSTLRIVCSVHPCLYKNPVNLLKACPTKTKTCDCGVLIIWCCSFCPPTLKCFWEYSPQVWQLALEKKMLGRRVPFL